MLQILQDFIIFFLDLGEDTVHRLLKIEYFDKA